MPTNTLPEFEYNRRVKALMEKIIPKGVCAADECREMFFLYNDKFDPRETGITCGGCVTRVANKMKEYYRSLNPKTD